MVVSATRSPSRATALPLLRRMNLISRSSACAGVRVSLSFRSMIQPSEVPGKVWCRPRKWPTSWARNAGPWSTSGWVLGMVTNPTSVRSFFHPCGIGRPMSGGPALPLPVGAGSVPQRKNTTIVPGRASATALGRAGHWASPRSMEFSQVSFIGSQSVSGSNTNWIPAGRKYWLVCFTVTARSAAVRVAARPPSLSDSGMAWSGSRWSWVSPGVEGDGFFGQRSRSSGKCQRLQARWRARFDRWP